MNIGSFFGGVLKIALGQPSSQTICISFHIAEHPIHYAFNKEE